MKRLAIGIDDFKKIIKEDCYYIDKTKFIEDILEDGSGVKLINRPRRFGKTLNMTTLKYFLISSKISSIIFILKLFFLILTFLFNFTKFNFAIDK